MNRMLVIPAAGRGSRLGSRGPKALHPVDGRPMIEFLLDRYAPLVDRIVVVVAPADVAAFQQQLGSRPALTFVEQPRPTGMLPAILTARPLVERQRPRYVWITWCDQIAISGDTIARLGAEIDANTGAAMVFPTVRQSPPYIHFVRDAAGLIVGVRQRREDDEMPATGESDAGLFALRLDAFLEHLAMFDRVPQRKAATTRERNFLPFIPWLASRQTVHTFMLEHPEEATGINTPEDARHVESYLRERRNSS